MSRARVVAAVLFCLIVSCGALRVSSLDAQEPEDWNTTRARGTTRDIEFSISEGTWM